MLFTLCVLCALCVLLIVDVVLSGERTFRPKRQSYYGRLLGLSLGFGVSSGLVAISAHDAPLFVFFGLLGVAAVIPASVLLFGRYANERDEIEAEKRARPYKVMEYMEGWVGMPCWTGRWVARPEDATAAGYTWRYEP